MRAGVFRRAYSPMAAGLLVLLAGCFSEPTLVAVKERCFQCLHDSCIDSNGYLIGFITEEYLYDDGTTKNGRERQAYASQNNPDACYGMCKSYWSYENGLWKCS
jgi:hypothetical protein